MTVLEIIFALILGVIAVVTHPSHLLIAGLLIPVIAIASFAMARPKWWLAPFLICLIVLGGFAERVLFASAVKTVRSSEVVYQPFLTARTIADGPGLMVLQDNCPNVEIPTCALYEALQKSDDPWRLTASHIMFESSPELGSFKFLSLEDQARVAHDQIPFFLKVLRERPIALTWSFLQNTLDQANLFSIQYTIPTEQTLVNVNNLTDIAMVVLIGVLVNAFVCGGISQPSDRYGARVAFLLPIATSFILLFYSGVRMPRGRKTTDI